VGARDMGGKNSAVAAPAGYAAAPPARRRMSS
jgi:hypothetical protein